MKKEKYCFSTKELLLNRTREEIEKLLLNKGFRLYSSESLNYKYISSSGGFLSGCDSFTKGHISGNIPLLLDEKSCSLNNLVI